MNDYIKGIDDTRTPLESRRRSDMSIRDVRYGFFKVVTEEIELPKCEKCGKEINGAALMVNGKVTHYSCGL